MGAGMFERESCYTADILIEFLVYSHVVEVLLMRAIVCSNGRCMSLTNIGIQTERVDGKVLNRECVVSETCRDLQFLVLSRVWGSCEADCNYAVRFQLLNTSACEAFLLLT